uniref:Uncharacterized protein n=2 Tax=Gloeochaete wittrockiana TaxID=38269 RepID=A0A096Y6U0_9EUKA|nr:hypothetical protein [Gloeochaete wittrockiana]
MRFKDSIPVNQVTKLLNNHYVLHRAPVEKTGLFYCHSFTRSPEPQIGRAFQISPNLIKGKLEQQYLVSPGYYTDISNIDLDKTLKGANYLKEHYQNLFTFIKEHHPEGYFDILNYDNIKAFVEAINNGLIQIT